MAGLLCGVLGLLVQGGAALAAAAAAGAGDEVAGSLNGEPVYLWEVEAHLRPAAPRVGTDPPPNPRRLAFDEAVRVRLLVREARARGLAGGEGPPDLVEARLVQALLRQETERQGIEPQAISEEEARSFYAAHRIEVSSIRSAEIAAITVVSPDLAEELLERAAGASAAQFLSLVEHHSVHPSKGSGGRLATIDKDGRGLEAPLARVAVGLKVAGAVGLAQGSDGLHYVLRATAVELEERPWDAELAQYTRNLMAFTRREEAVRGLLARLRGGASIEIEERVLDRLPVPSWETYSGPGS